MHSSWLFPGASSIPRQTADAASGDRANNNNGASFEVNSFVRSLNLQGVQSPGNFPFKGVINNKNKRIWSKPNTDKSLNELLNVLNDSVDRVVECGSEDKSNTSSFGSFRSGVEERDPAALNDLINLVSTTANEFCDINGGNAKTESTAKNVDLHYSANPVNPLDIGMGTLVHPEIIARNDKGCGYFFVSGSTTPKINKSDGNSNAGMTTERSYPPFKKRNKKGIELDDSTTEFFTPPELIEIYSENQSPGVQRANVSAESLETLGYFETPRCFLPEVIRLTKAAGFVDNSLDSRDRNRSNCMPQARRINFEGELWPIGNGANSGKAFSPFFTGVKDFRRRTTDMHFINDTERSMNSSRSSPIFSGAGEAPAEPLEIVVPTRDRDDSFEQLEKSKNMSGSNGDCMIPEAIPIEGNFFDVPPTKLSKSDDDFRNFIIEEGKQKSQTDEKNTSSNISKEPEFPFDTDEEKIKRKACVKVLTKRNRKYWKQSKKNARKKNSVMSDDEDTGEENFSSNSQSPIISARKSSMQCFLAASTADIGSDEEKMMDSVRGVDSVETQMEICAKTRLANNDFNDEELKGKPAKIIIDSKIKLPVNCNFLLESQESSKFISKRSSLVESNQSVMSSKKLGNLKNVHQKGRVNNFSQPIWKPAGSNKVAPSTSSSSIPRQSRIAHLTSRLRSNTTETPNKCKENTEATTTKSKVPVVRKNHSQNIITERSCDKSLAMKSEATVKTPKKTGTSENVRFNIKSVSQDKNSRPSSSRDQIGRSVKFTGSHLKTTIPVLRSKTFVYQINGDGTVRRASSKEDYVTNPKSASIRNQADSLNSGPMKHTFRKPLTDCAAMSKKVNLSLDGNAEDPLFDSEINTDAEQSCSNFQLNSKSNVDKICAVDFSSNDSIAVKKIAPKKNVTKSASEENTREEIGQPISRDKFHNKHARSLRMLKSILSHQGVNVEAINKSAKEIGSKISSEMEKKSKIPNPGDEKSSAVLRCKRSNTASSPGASKNLFEKLAVLTESLPDRREPERRDFCEQSVFSFVDNASESTTSYARSMRDAEEQCSLHYESSFVSQTSLPSINSSDSQKLLEIKKQVSNVSTEIDEDYRRTIYVDAAVSSSETKLKSFEAAETQTRVKVSDKNLATEEIIQPATNCIDNTNTEIKLISSSSQYENTDFKELEIEAETQTRVNLLEKNVATEKIIVPAPMCINVDTETQLIAPASKDTNTDFKIPENVDATSQMDTAANSLNIASGKDFSDIECSSKHVNTERSDFFMKSRGVCFRGPCKIDGASQFETPETSKDTASGRDYVEMQSISEDVNTERQDYLFEDRSVDVLRATTAEEGCQINPAPMKIANIAVGEFSLSVKSSPEEILLSKLSHDLQSIETVVVKDVDIVQWQSSTTFNSSRINCGSTCSSTSSLVAWRPKYSKKSSAEMFQAMGDRVPKQAIVALEMASERAQNLYKAIGIYRENLANNKMKEPLLQSGTSVEKDQSLIKSGTNVKSITQPKKSCSFRRNSKIKSLLVANLEKLCPEMNNSPIEFTENNTKSLKIQEEITCLMNDLITSVVEVIKTESEYWACQDIDKSYLGEHNFVQRKKRQSLTEVTEVLEGINVNEDNLQLTSKTLEFFFFSRNSLLTVIYGTVCSLVFWALQFSITCDSV